MRASGGSSTGMELSSPAFADGDPIPVRHTCDGEDVSPPLAWTGPPESTVSLALCLDDPDAGRYPFTHWLAWGLTPVAGSLAEGEPGPAEGRNDFGASGYRGPCPPPGKPHRYVFTLYALDAEPELGPSDRRLSFDRALEGHVIASATLVGRYGR
jgi:Raf kinase inhibitor-like YbhB/YbcL family protein